MDRLHRAYRAATARLVAGYVAALVLVVGGGMLLQTACGGQVGSTVRYAGAGARGIAPTASYLLRVGSGDQAYTVEVDAYDLPNGDRCYLGGTTTPSCAHLGTATP